MSTQSKNQSCRGFTLMELVVTIGIIGVIAVLVIPTVRTLNEDRKVRDTARVVGAVFASARERAAVDGVAGVEIASVANASGTYNLPNMGLVLYQLRAIPAYPGEVANHYAFVLNDLTAPVEYARINPAPPAGQNVDGTDGFAYIHFRNANVWDDSMPPTSAELPLGIDIGPGDFIEFNDNGVLYEVVNGGGTNQNVQVRVPYHQPIIPYQPHPTDSPAAIDEAPGYVIGTSATALRFKVHRRPVRIESSAVRLPNNLFLNMAWSGHGLAPNTVSDSNNQCIGIQFRDFDPNNVPGIYPAPASFPSPEGSTKIWFNSDGSIGRVTTRGFIINPQPPLGATEYDVSFLEKPGGPVYLLLCTGDGDDTDLTRLQLSDFINRADNMWITIDHRNGSVSVDKMAQMDPVETASNTFRQQVQDARLLARSRRSATP